MGSAIKKDNRFSSFTIAGHSEDALLGMIAANKIVATKYISISGVGIPAVEIIKKQSSAQPQNIQDLYVPRLVTLAAGKTLSTVPPAMYSLLRPSIQP